MTRKEDLSALMDGELDGQRREALLDGMGKAADEAVRWERYHLIRDAMQNELPEQLDVELATRVRAALEDEPTVLAPRRNGQRWRRWGVHLGRQAAGLAVAASVAVAVVMVAWQPDGRTPGAAEGTAVTAEREAGSGAAPGVADRFAASSGNEGAARVAHGAPSGGRNVARGSTPGGAELERYLVNHSEYSSSASVQGMLSYMRVVGHSAEGGGMDANGRR